MDEGYGVLHFGEGGADAAVDESVDVGGFCHFLPVAGGWVEGGVGFHDVEHLEEGLHGDAEDFLSGFGVDVECVD